VVRPFLESRRAAAASRAGRRDSMTGLTSIIG